MKKILISFFKKFMQSLMFRFIRKKHKIFNSIVISNMINMMNNLFRQKESIEFFFHNKTTSFNIIMIGFKRMIGTINKNISSMFNFTLKEEVFFSFFKRSFIRFHNSLCFSIPRLLSFFKFCERRIMLSFLRLNMTFLRTIKLFINQTFFNIKTFFTPFTFFKHSILFHIISFLIIISLIFGLSTNSFSATAWRNGTGANTILGTESASDIDSVSYNNYTYPIDSMMRNYHRGVRIAYASASTLTVSIGEIMLSNAAGTIRLMQANTSAITAAWTMIDTGAEAASTTYYLWAYQETVDDDDFDVTISTSSTAPSGKTYFARIGSFYNDSSSNIIRITNDEPHQTATYDSGWFAVAVNSTYSKTHGLGTTKVLSTLWFSNSSTGASNVFEVYQTHPNNVGGQVYDLDTTSLDIYTDATHVAQKVIAAGSVTSYTSGYYRVILIGLE